MDRIEEIRQLAYDAHRGTSFTPEERARQVVEDYESNLKAAYDAVRPHAETGEQKALLDREFLRFEVGYTERYKAWLQAKSRVMSPMITGPSKFPAARNQKHLDIETRRLRELIDYHDRGIKAIIKHLKAARNAEQVNDEEYERLRVAIVNGVASCKGIETGKIVAYRDLFKASIEGKIKRSAQNGNVEAVKKALIFLKNAQRVLNKPLFGPRHSIWRLAEAAETVEANRKTGFETEQRHGIEIERDYDDDRCRIYLPSKPAEEVRTALKKAGWRWSPTTGAWQRKNTEAAFYSAQTLVDRFYKDKEGRD